MDSPGDAALSGMLETAAPGLPAQARAETLALLARARGDVQVRQWMLDLAPYVEGEPPPLLREYLHLALLGVCAGFLERALSPYAPQHREIIPPLLDEVRAVYARLVDLGGEYDPEEFRYRAFHYGLHKACYLDWRLYLSNTCY